MSTLTAICFALAAGVNAPLALLACGLVARISPDYLPLTDRFDFLSAPWFLALTGLWLTAELALDKLPGASALNDRLQAPLRPAAAALLFIGVAHPLSHDLPTLAAVIGAGIGLTVHTLKTVYRGRLRGRAAGLADVGASLGEDAVAGLACIVAAFVPVLALLLLLPGLAVMVAVVVAMRPVSAHAQTD